MTESAEARYSRVVREYEKHFGELPKILFTCGEGLELCLDLMEQAIQGKRGKVSEVDFGYPPGADV
jgi:hypothetical protein